MRSAIAQTESPRFTSTTDQPCPACDATVAGCGSRQGEPRCRRFGEICGTLMQDRRTRHEVRSEPASVGDAVIASGSTATRIVANLRPSEPSPPRRRWPRRRHPVAKLEHELRRPRCRSGRQRRSIRRPTRQRKKMSTRAADESRPSARRSPHDRRSSTDQRQGALKTVQRRDVTEPLRRRTRRAAAGSPTTQQRRRDTIAEASRMPDRVRHRLLIDAGIGGSFTAVVRRRRRRQMPTLCRLRDDPSW